jgi:hypothetical protein
MHGLIAIVRSAFIVELHFCLVFGVALLCVVLEGGVNIGQWVYHVQNFHPLTSPSHSAISLCIGHYQCAFSVLNMHHPLTRTPHLLFSSQVNDVRARIQDYVRQGGVKPAPGPEKNKFMKGLDVLTGKALPDFGSKSSPATEGYVQRLLCAAGVVDRLGFVGVIAGLTVGVIAQLWVC